MRALDRRGLLRRIPLAPLRTGRHRRAARADVRRVPHDELVEPALRADGRQPLHARRDAQPRIAGAGRSALVVTTSRPRSRAPAHGRARTRHRRAPLPGVALRDPTSPSKRSRTRSGPASERRRTLVDRAVDRERAPAEHARLVLLLPPVVPPRAQSPTSPLSERADGHRNIAGALEAARCLSRTAARRTGAPAPAPTCPRRSRDTRGRPARIRCACSNRPRRPSWFALALQYLPDESERGLLLVQLAGGPATRRRPTESRDACRRPLQLALTTNDDQLILEIVRASSAGWVYLLLSGAQALLARALEVVDDDATRARILARQAADLSVTDPPTGGTHRRRGRRDRPSEPRHHRARGSAAPAHVGVARAAQPRRPGACPPRAARSERESPDVSTRYFALSTAVVTAIQTRRPRRESSAAAQRPTRSRSRTASRRCGGAAMTRACLAGRARRTARARRGTDRSRPRLRGRQPRSREPRRRTAATGFAALATRSHAARRCPPPASRSTRYRRRCPRSRSRSPARSRPTSPARRGSRAPHRVRRRPPSASCGAARSGRRCSCSRPRPRTCSSLPEASSDHQRPPGALRRPGRVHRQLGDRTHRLWRWRRDGRLRRPVRRPPAPPGRRHRGAPRGPRARRPGLPSRDAWAGAERRPVVRQGAPPWDRHPEGGRNLGVDTSMATRAFASPSKTEPAAPKGGRLRNSERWVPRRLRGARGRRRRPRGDATSTSRGPRSDGCAHG